MVSLITKYVRKKMRKRRNVEVKPDEGIQFLSYCISYLVGASIKLQQEPSKEILEISNREIFACYKQARTNKLSVDDAINLALNNPLTTVIYSDESIQYSIKYAENMLKKRII